MPDFYAVLLMIANIIVPGLGTIIVSFWAKKRLDIFVAGVFQFFTTVCIVGWVWSFWWGMFIFYRSQDKIKV